MHVIWVKQTLCCIHSAYNTLSAIITKLNCNLDIWYSAPLQHRLYEDEQYNVQGLTNKLQYRYMQGWTSS